MTDNGKWYGSPSVRNGSTLDVTVGEGGLWSYAENSLYIGTGTDGAAEVSHVTWTSTEVSDSVLKVQNDGTWNQGIVLMGKESQGTVTIGKTGTWTYPETSAASDPAETGDYLLALVGDGSALSLTDEGSVTGFIVAVKAGTDSKALTASVSGAWNGGLQLLSGRTLISRSTRAGRLRTACSRGRTQ